MNYMKKLPTYLFILMNLSLCGALVLGSCATSSGGTYSRSVQADEAAARKSRSAKEASPGGSGGATGSTSNDSSFWSSTTSASTAIIITETPPHGTVKLLGLPFGTPVLVDGQYNSGNSFELSPGKHYIEVRVFGFEVWEETIQVDENKTTLLQVQLVPAQFHIIDVVAKNVSFNPDNPGFFGKALLTVNVTTPGTIQCRVINADNRPVKTFKPINVDKASVNVFWDGCDEQGQVCSPGTFTLLIQALNERGEVIGSEFRQDVFLNHSTLRRTWLGGSGFSGPFFVPDAQILPEQTWVLGTALVSHLASPDEPVASTLVSLNSMRLSLNEYSEFSFLFSAVLRPRATDTSTNWAGFTGSWKLRLFEGPLSAAVGIRGTFRSFNEESTAYYPPAWDGLANFDGLSLSLPLEYRDGPLRLFAAPELQVSNFYPYWTDNRWPTPDLFVWSTLRLGLETRFTNPLRFALSAALKSEPLNKGLLALQLPLSLGAELSLYTNSPVNFTAYALGEAGGPYSYAVYGGIGIGVQF
jgi:hypothetical protein